MRRRIMLLLVCLSLLWLAGCSSLNSDEFYALPRRSEAYNDLERAVQAALVGLSYSAPVSGSNRQVLQQADLDGDGQEEILVFAKADSERPLRLMLFRHSEAGFALVCTVEGDGSAFDSVQYAQIDGKPGLEILLSRRVSEQVQPFLSVYTLENNLARELMSSRYNAYITADLTGDNLTDLVLLQANSQGPADFAELYSFRGDELTRLGEASLSMNLENVKRMITGFASEDLPAVFVASAYDESNLITDVLALSGGAFQNISLNQDSGQSSQTVRNYYVYSTDIDGDGLIELPDTVLLGDLGQDENARDQYAIVWYNLSADGSRREKLCTYHNYAEGWFLYLPDSWRHDLVVTKKSLNGTVGTRLLRKDDAGQSDLITVYAMSQEKAAALTGEKWTVLGRRGDVVYMAQVGDGLDLDEQELQDRFSFIAPDLLPGN